MKKIVMIIMVLLAPSIAMAASTFRMHEKLEKVSPAGNDILLIEDGSDGYKMKHIQLTNLPISLPVQQALDAKANSGDVFSGSWIDLADKPSLFSGDYNDLINKPVIPVDTNTQLTEAQVDAMADNNGYLKSYTETDPLFSGWDKDYADLINRPTLFSGAWADITGKPVLFSGSYNDLTNKPSIPTSLAALSGDTTHRTVTDAEKTTWNTSAGSGFSGDYNDLINKPVIPVDTNTQLTEAQVDAYANNNGYLKSYTETDPLFSAWNKSYNDLTNKPTTITAGQASAITANTAKITYPSSASTKLAGIATGATANSTDALLRDRTTHTGTQTISTVTGLQAALDTKVDDIVLVNGEVGEVLLPEDPANGTNTIGFSAPAALASDVTFQLPAVLGAVGDGFRVASVAGGVAVLEQYHLPVVTISTSQPTGGSHGDVWYVVQ